MSIVGPDAGASASSPRRELWIDRAFIAFVVLLSASFYVHRLGFSSDDWTFLGSFVGSPDQSLPALVPATGEPGRVRPVQVVELALLYRLFGLHPVGYHVVHTGILAALALVLNAVLRRLGQPRLVALAVPIVYLTLPSYSAARFWYSSFQAATSTALYLVTLHLDLRSMESRSRFWAWRAASLATLLGSALGYEVPVPIFLANPVLAWHHGRRLQRDPRAVSRRTAFIAATTIVPLVAVMAYKAHMTTRQTISGSLTGFFLAIARRAITRRFDPQDYGFNLWQAIGLHFGDYGLGLPRIVWRIVRDRPDVVAATIAAITALVVFAYLTKLRDDGGDPGRYGLRPWTTLVAAGPIVFLLGYAIFLTNWAIRFSPTGLATRTAVVAALGTALTFVGIAGAGAVRLRSAAGRKRLFCGFVAVLCGTGLLILNTIASSYVAAYREASMVLASLRRDLPSLPEGSTLILDGVCPYVGPAVVFESNWDLEGALRILYRDRTLRADLVSPRMTVGDDYISTTIYDTLQKRYPYEQLVIYNPARKSARWITSAGELRGYLQAFNPDLTSGCPRGYEGHGVSIF
jgi:hypothetical protein